VLREDTADVYELRAGNVPGIAELSAGAASAVVAFEMAPPIGAQLHVHGPISEGDGTHAFQTAQAEQWGTTVLWWTDHDYRYWLDWYRHPEWSVGTPLVTERPPELSARAAWWEFEDPVSAWLDEEVLIDDTPTLVVSTASTTLGVIRWDTSLRRHYRPLLSDVRLAFSIEPSPNAQLRVVVPLSRTDPAHERSLVFARPDDVVEAPGAVVIDTDWLESGWTHIDLALSAWADDNLPEGRDSTVRGFELHLASNDDAPATARLSGLSLTEALAGEALMQAQIDSLAQIGGPVVQLVGQEISYQTEPELHLTAYGMGNRFVDYEQLSLGEDAAEIVDHVHEDGGLVGFTHPFGVTVGLGGDASLVDVTCASLSSSGLYGADLLEVGYVERVLGLAEHLALWDCLSSAGHVVTGIGTSDLHVTKPWDATANNFVTWVAAEHADDASLLAALSAGKAFFGSGTEVAAPLVEFTVPGRASMGQVVDLSGEVQLRARLRPLRLQDEVRWVVGGELVGSSTGHEGEVVVTHTVDVTGRSFARVEVWNKAGAGLLFSNPIYFSPAEVASRTPAP
jgi:hypothetical protein